MGKWLDAVKRKGQTTGEAVAVVDHRHDRTTQTKTAHPTELDPRPDLSADHDLWDHLLAAAKATDPDIWGPLYGLRCIGTTMSVRRTRSGLPFLRLEYDEAAKADGWAPEAFVAQWLTPKREAITDLFRKVMAAYLDERCPNCGSKRWWVSVEGARVCYICQPAQVRDQ